MDQLEEFLLKLVDLLSHKERINECKVGIREVTIVPNFLCNQKRAEKHGSPVGGLQGHFSKRNEPINVNETDDAALGTELSAIVQGFNEFQNVLDGRCLAQQANSLAVECIWVLKDVLLLREEEQLAVLFDSLALILVLEHLRVQNGRHRVDDALNVRLLDGRANVHRVHGRRLAHLNFLLFTCLHFFT